MKRRGKLADRVDRLMRGDAMKATSSVRKAAAILLCGSFVCLGAACTAKEGSQPTLQGEEAEYPPVADDLHLKGQRLSVEAGRLSSDQVSSATPARICVVASSACFEAPQYFGSNPQAESVELRPGRSAVLFRATASAGGSGSTTALWILDLQDGRFVSLTPEIQISGQSEYALWNERDISTAPILVTADYVYGVGETHFSRHRFRIRAYMLEAAREASGMPEYNLRTDFVTDERYPSFDETDRIDVLSNERSSVLAQLRGTVARVGSPDGGAYENGPAPSQDLLAQFRATCGKVAWNKDKCAQAREALERRGAAAVPALEELLGDPDFNVVADAARTLGNMGAAAAPAVPGLIQTLGHDHGAVTRAAIDALAKLAPQVPGIVPTLVKLADGFPQDPIRDISHRVLESNVLDALGAIGPPAEAAIPALTAAMNKMKSKPYSYIDLPGRTATTLEKIGAAKHPELARDRIYPMDPKIEQALSEYETVYKSIAGSDTPSADSVVHFYNLFSRLEDAFTHTPWQGNENEYRKIEARAPGVTIWSFEIIKMVRDMQFFMGLADRTRDPDAIRLFTLLQETYPNSVLFCKDRATDYGWCTMFGEGKFVDFYSRWSSFQPATASIRQVVQAERAGIIEAMKESCVCPASAEPVIREYELFLERFATVPGADDLRRRLSEIKAGTAGLKFDCRPG